jgi:hypothetical protein
VVGGARVYNRLMQRWMGSLALISLIIGACGNAPQATPTVVVSEARPTASGPATQSPDTGSTPQQDCVDDAAFVADLTLPDGSQVAPGDRLVKQWSVQNTGSCDWGPAYRLMPILPNPLSDDSPVALYPARAGTQAVWQVSLQAPNTPGEVIGRWQAQNPDGTAFGQEVYVVLVVMAAGASPSSEPSTVSSAVPSTVRPTESPAP